MTSTSQITDRGWPVALVTGASKGLGRALARALHARGWQLVFDARTQRDLAAVSRELPGAVAVPGDVTDPVHRRSLVSAVASFGRLALLVNNASTLGASPLPPLAALPLDTLRHVYETNVVAPLALVQALLPSLEPGGIVVGISSDAASEAYAGWGGYGSSKAALDQVHAVLAVEHPGLHVYSVDPGDLRTDLHQQAFPGDDISDRPEPETVVPALLRLLDERPASGRYRAGDLLPAGAGA